MAFYELDEVFGYQDANNMKKLWANSTAPDNPGEGEIWLDISGELLQLKRYNGSDWESIGEMSSDELLTRLTAVDGPGSGLDADTLDGLQAESLLRSDTSDSFSGTLTSTLSSGAVIKFDNGDSMITVHDGNGHFNIKAGVDESHLIAKSDGASHLELSETGTITAAVSSQSVGETFTDDAYVQISNTGVVVEAPQFSVKQGGVEKLKVGTDGKIYEGSMKLEDKYIMREDFIFDKNVTTGALPRAGETPLTVLNVTGRGAAQVSFGNGNDTASPFRYIYNLKVWIDGVVVCDGYQSVGSVLTYHFNSSIRIDAQQTDLYAKCNVSYCNN